MLKTNLRIGLIFIFFAMYFSCLVLISTFDLIQSNEYQKYYQLVFSSALIFLLIFIKKYIYDIEFPVLIIILVFAFYNIVGFLNSLILETIFLQSSTDIITTLSYVNYAIFTLILGLFTVCTIIPATRSIKSISFYIWNLQKLRFLVYVLFSVCILALVGFLLQGGGLLLLSEDPSIEYQVKWYPDASVLFSKIYFLTFPLCALISGIYLCLIMKNGMPQKKRIILVILSVSLINLILTGKRSYVLIPTFTIIFAYHYYTKKINLWRLIILSAIVVFLVIMVGYVRTGGILIKEIGWSKGIFLSFGGEFTALARIIYKYPEGKIFEPNTLLKSAILPLFPRQIWAMIGFDKMAEYRLSGLTISSLLYDEAGHSGIRVGMIGELFLEFGLLGIILGMFIFGCVLGILDRLLKRSHALDIRILFSSFILSIMFYLIVGQFDGAFSNLYYNLYILIIFSLLCRKKLFNNACQHLKVA